MSSGIGPETVVGSLPSGLGPETGVGGLGEEVGPESVGTDGGR